MCGLAVVPKCGLGEAFRVSAGIGAFRPSVAVGMERHALKARQLAAPVKLGGAVGVAGGGRTYVRTYLNPKGIG